MVERVIVLGAHSYFGFTLCEKLLEEGVEVIAYFNESISQDSNNILHERLMLIGRNANFHTNFSYRKIKEDEADLVIFCQEEVDDQEILTKSASLAKEMNIPFLLVQINVKIKKDLSLDVEEYTVVQFPKLFGPFQSPSEEIHQYLLDYMNKKERKLVIKEPIMYIDDAVNCTWEFIQTPEQGKVYSFLSELKDDEFGSFSVELKMNAIPNRDDTIEHCFLNTHTPIEKGFFKQLACIKKYEQIFKHN